MVTRLVLEFDVGNEKSNYGVLMLFRFGKYNKLFRPNGLIMPGYLSLLNLYDKESAIALDQVEFANRNGGKQKHIDRMFSSRNWRPHLVACCALLLDREGRFTTDSLWECLKNGGFVTPQLVVTASLKEPEFEARIAKLLKSLPAKPSMLEKSVAKYYSEDYLNDISLRYSKLINALHAIIGYESITDQLDKEIVDKTIAKNFDSGDKFAVDWRAKIIDLLQQRGIQY